ncbi:MAG TPA: carbamoyltransferase [Gemmatimonadaceae bacterium]|nr:carbamoyltransferase [Gemmatimonadaceae bacterium]HRQ78876.1 carbamoyltransferase [Gemmatimonadaceae bacterium]
MSSSPQYVLGLAAYYHDSAACLLRDGAIVAAASEERFTRKKGDASFPRQAVAYCLREAGIELSALSAVAFYDKPLLKFERLLETYVAIAPRGFRSFLRAGPVWMREKLFTDREIRAELEGYGGHIRYTEHHESHAASAFFPSPFDEAAVVTLDGVGEWATTSIAVGSGNDLRVVQEMHYPDSLGLLYSAFTYYLGFKVNSGEYKVMGLAPYGEPRYVDTIYRHLLDVHPDGSFTLDQRYFDYLGGLRMTSAAFDTLFGGPPRASETPLTQRHMDIARSIQQVCEELMLGIVRTAHRVTGLDDLCLAGGVALNCVGNGRILREGPFRRIWIQPAAGDAGGALGAAQLAWHRALKAPRPSPAGRDAMQGALLGPQFSDDEILAFLQGRQIPYERLDGDALTARVADALADGAVVGWFQGRMEFGPRALGARSILGDPRSPTMQAQMNLKIKFRESFRPFAPAVLAARADEYFALDVESPYMLLVAPVQERRRLAPSAGDAFGIERLNQPRSDIPAVTHLDHSARVQTVTADSNPAFHALLEAFEARTGCAVLVNTSFNVRGEPIVCTPDDAYRCFRRTHMDLLVLGSFVLTREHLPPTPEDEAWKTEFELD